MVDNFSELETLQIRAYLGYSVRWDREADQVARALQYANGNDTIKTYVRGTLLPKLASIETQIDGRVSEMVGLKSIDKGDVVWKDGAGFTDPVCGALYSMGSRYINQLSIILCVPPYADYFGVKGSPGEITNAVHNNGEARKAWVGAR